MPDFAVAWLGEDILIDGEVPLAFNTFMSSLNTATWPTVIRGAKQHLGLYEKAKNKAVMARQCKSHLLSLIKLSILTYRCTALEKAGNSATLTQVREYLRLTKTFIAKAQMVQAHDAVLEDISDGLEGLLDVWGLSVNGKNKKGMCQSSVMTMIAYLLLFAYRIHPCCP